MDREEFYKTCASLLDCETDYEELVFKEYYNREGIKVKPMTNASHWIYKPGNGRFAGHGFIRVFATDNIHVALRSIGLYGHYNSYEPVLEKIKERVDGASSHA